MNERVTVDLDGEAYYLDGEFWCSWDKFGEDMAEYINILLDKQDKRIKQLEARLIDEYDGFICSVCKHHDIEHIPPHFEFYDECTKHNDYIESKITDCEDFEFDLEGY